MGKISLILPCIEFVTTVIIDCCAVSFIFSKIGEAIDKKVDSLDLKTIENNYENDRRFVDKIYALGEEMDKLEDE